MELFVLIGVVGMVIAALKSRPRVVAGVVAAALALIAAIVAQGRYLRCRPLGLARSHLRGVSS